MIVVVIFGHRNFRSRYCTVMRVLVVVRIQVVSGSVEEVDGVNSRCTAVVGSGKGHVAGAGSCTVKNGTGAVGPAGKRITVAVVGIVILNSGSYDSVTEVAGDGCGLLNMAVIIVIEVDGVVDIMLLEYGNVFGIVTDNERIRILGKVGNHSAVVVDTFTVDDMVFHAVCSGSHGPALELISVGGICRLGRLGCRHDNVVSVVIVRLFSKNITVGVIEGNGVFLRRSSFIFSDEYGVAYQFCLLCGLIFNIFIVLAVKILCGINLPSREVHVGTCRAEDRIMVAVKEFILRCGIYGFIKGFVDCRIVTVKVEKRCIPSAR